MTPAQLLAAQYGLAGLGGAGGAASINGSPNMAAILSGMVPPELLGAPPLTGGLFSALPFELQSFGGPGGAAPPPGINNLLASVSGATAPPSAGGGGGAAAALPSPVPPVPVGEAVAAPPQLLGPPVSAGLPFATPHPTKPPVPVGGGLPFATPHPLLGPPIALGGGGTLGVPPTPVPPVAAGGDAGAGEATQGALERRRRRRPQPPGRREARQNRRQAFLRGQGPGPSRERRQARRVTAQQPNRPRVGGLF